MATNTELLAALVKRNSDLATLISKLQSRIDTLDPENSLRLLIEDGIYNSTFNITNDGMALTVSATGTYTAGNYSEAIVDGRYIKVDDTQSFYTLQNGDSTNPRIDIVYIGRYGIGVVQGTPAASPSEPDLPENTMAIYKITVPANEADGSGLTFTDVRTALAGFATLESSKADKVSGATAGNLAGLDADGNLTDSGKSPSDFEVAGAVATHESTYDHTQLHTHSNKTILDAITDAGSGQIITDAERTALGNKADKTIPAADGNLAALDGTTGNLVDSGKPATDIHTHANKTLLDSLIDSGAGNNFLADDGTYKTISSGGGATVTVNTSDIFSDSSETSFFKLDENANDETGTHNGTWHGTEQYEVGGFGLGAKLDGASYITDFSTSLSAAGESRTISVWVKITALPPSGNRYGIIGTRNGSSNGWVLTITDTGDVFYYHTGGNSISLGNAIPLNCFTHIVASYDKTSDIAKIYANGVLLAQYTSFGADVDPSFNGAIGTEGLNGGSPYQYFKGVIDQIRIYNRALTDDEVLVLFKEIL